MKILIVSQYFFPENFKINDLAVELKNRGHSVSVLTGIPNYPSGNFFKGYGYFKNRTEDYKGVFIRRSFIINRGSSSKIRLAINYLSFVIGALIESFFLLGKKYDVIFVFEPSPITVCIPAIFIKKLRKIPICLWVLDLWPENVESVGKFKTRIIPKLLESLVRFIYQQTDSILVSSKGFISSISSKNVSLKKIKYIPQWAEVIFRPVERKNNLFNKIPKSTFKIMFAGNIGDCQDFPSILKAARILKNDINIQWIIIGGGRKEQWVKKQVIKNKLGNTFHLLGSFPLEEMPKFYSEADCMILSLKKEYIFSLTVPAKIQTYLACGKPIVAMVNGEAASIINEARVGLASPSENPKLFAENIKSMSKLPKSDLHKMGTNALHYYKSEFERSLIIKKIENVLESESKKNFG